MMKNTMTKKIILSTAVSVALLSTSASSLTLDERIAKLEKIILALFISPLQYSKSSSSERFEAGLLVIW